MRSNDTVVAALNGLIGDRLADAGHPLAIEMCFRRAGLPLALDGRALAEQIPDAHTKLLVLVHGLCHSDLQWCRDGHDHGAALARALGYTAIYLRYNSGRHISTNGREFAKLLDVLVANWPVEVDEIAILGYSMGGLVARSACYYGQRARARWLGKLRQLVFLGTPHHGVPLERGGNWLMETLGQNTFTAPVAHLARLRSAGITDLRHGSLVDQDWRGKDRFAHHADQRVHVPLPRRARCYTIAGTAGQRQGDLRDMLLGDGIVPIDTALGRHADAARTLRFAKSRQWVGYGVRHLELLHRPAVFDQLKQWLGSA